MRKLKDNHGRVGQGHISPSIQPEQPVSSHYESNADKDAIRV